MLKWGLRVGWGLIYASGVTLCWSAIVAFFLLMLGWVVVYAIDVFNIENELLTLTKEKRLLRMALLQMDVTIAELDQIAPWSHKQIQVVDSTVDSAPTRKPDNTN